VLGILSNWRIASMMVDVCEIRLGVKLIISVHFPLHFDLVVFFIFPGS